MKVKGVECSTCGDRIWTVKRDQWRECACGNIELQHGGVVVFGEHYRWIDIEIHDNDARKPEGCE